MSVREQLKYEIDRVDERYLELLFNVVRQFPPNQASQKPPTEQRNEKIVALFQEMADKGGLGIADPQQWQREIRQDRPLPNRE